MHHDRVGRLRGRIVALDHDLLRWRSRRSGLDYDHTLLVVMATRREHDGAEDKNQFLQRR